MTKPSSKVVVQVYRSLLRVSRPFSYPSPHATLLTSLLHRKGIPDYEDSNRGLPAEIAHYLDKEFSHSQTTTLADQEAMKPLSVPHARDLRRSYRELQKIEHYNADASNNLDPPHQILFRFLLHELMGSGEKLTRFPSQLSEPDLLKLRSIIRREFRSASSQTLPSSMSDRFPYRVRVQTSFLALRELNKKICYARSQGLVMHSSRSSEGQDPIRVKDVFPLPTPSYLRPDHTEVSSSSSSYANAAHGGTYGLIINKPTTIRKRSKTPGGAARASNFTTEVATVSDIFRDIVSVEFHAAFNDCTLRTGGPVHASVQMLYKCKPDEELSLQLGGKVLPVILPSVCRAEADASSTAEPAQLISASLESDEAIYFQGDFVRVAKAVLEGNLSKDSVSFLVGATVWSAGQLRTEIERGWWMPCTAPPQMTLTGKSIPDSLDQKDHVEGHSLWSSMMAGISEEEAKLAHLFRENISNENIDACDEF